MSERNDERIEANDNNNEKLMIFCDEGDAVVAAVSLLLLLLGVKFWASPFKGVTFRARRKCLALEKRRDR
jgi:hypothetical protein